MYEIIVNFAFINLFIPNKKVGPWMFPLKNISLYLTIPVNLKSGLIIGVPLKEGATVPLIPWNCKNKCSLTHLWTPKKNGIKGFKDYHDNLYLFWNYCWTFCQYFCSRPFHHKHEINKITSIIIVSWLIWLNTHSVQIMDINEHND